MQIEHLTPFSLKRGFQLFVYSYSFYLHLLQLFNNPVESLTTNLAQYLYNVFTFCICKLMSFLVVYSLSATEKRKSIKHFLTGRCCGREGLYKKITVHYPLEVNTRKYPAQRDNELEEKERGIESKDFPDMSTLTKKKLGIISVFNIERKTCCLHFNRNTK